MSNPEHKKLSGNDGHRGRLRERYYRSGIDALEEYEIIELILHYSIPRKDTKNIAKTLIENMYGFTNVIDASIDDLVNKGKIPFRSAVLIKLLNDTNKKYEQIKLSDKINIDCSDSAGDYIRSKLRYEKVENFIVVCLNNSNQLLGSEIIAKGDINEVVIYVRKIIEIAIRFNSNNIIIGHNHPSGNTKPSKSDIMLTNRVYKALSYSGITLIDHIIVSEKENGFYSFLSNDKIDKEI